MAGLESVPAFTERARQIGLSEDLLGKFVAKNLDTYGKLAFICSSRPSSGDDKALFDSINALIGSEVPVEQQSVVRRLWYEAHSHALVDLEARASRTGETSPREMPLAERLTRLKRQRGELKGLELDVHTEPRHALVDRVQAMLDSAQVLHIPPEKCISRHDEILGDKSEQKLSLGADGNIKITKQATSLRCETTGELKLRRCFLRRALAFDQVGLASFVTMESWHNKMFQALLGAPPAGYRYTTVQQLLASDQKLWQVVAQDSRGDISIGVGMPAPLDKHIVAASNSQFVMSCLTHLPKPPEAPAQPWRPSKGKGEKGDKGGKGGKGKNGKGKNFPNQCRCSSNDFIEGVVAKRLMQQREPITASQVAALFDALPHDECDRDAEGISFSAGLFSRVQAVNRFATSLLSDAVYTSFAIFSRVQTRAHRDTQHYQHSTAPFTGRRLVLVLFSLQAASIAVQLAPALLSQLPSRAHIVSEGSNPLPRQGQLAAAAMQSGWDAIPIGKRFLTVGTTPLVPLDLTDEPSLDHLLNFDSQVVADWWHGHLFLKSCTRTSGKNHDRPLRSADYVFGNPNLPPAAEHLVQQDNCLCRALVAVLARAFATGALVSLVGPARSHCWSLLASCVKQRGPSAFVDWFFALSDQELDTCMFGASFLTSVRIKASVTWCDQLPLGASNFVPRLPLSQVPPGIYHTMEEHLHKACQLPCPADTSSRLPDTVRRNIFSVLTEGPLAISKKRMLALQALNAQLAELSSAEAELRKNMHPDVEAVTRGKAIALFGRLLEETGFPDMSVIDLLRDGVPLVGQENASALFDKRPKPQDIDPEQLKAQAMLRRQVLQQMKGLASGEDYASMKSETEAEVAAGFMSGPFHSEQEVSSELGTDDWSLSTRFLLRQGEDSKVRIIDDFKMSAVNRAFGSTSFLELQDTDYAVGLLRFISRVLQDKKRVKVPLADGTVLEGDWSPEMLARPDLLGKTLDLSKAYRQVGIHPDTRDRAVLGFPSPSGAWEFYIAKSLPFGAAASVYGFNKIALAILHIM
ncbi:unnamed protein product, partial [Symbiodinium sp. CCMP2456]